MNPLKRLIDTALDDNAPLSSVLRQAMVVSYRLDFRELADWVQHELDGYPKGVDLPDYRQFSTRSYAMLRNPYQGSMPSADVMRANLPDWVREFIDQPVEFREGVAAVLALSEGDGDLQQPWPQEIAVKYGGNGYMKDWECLKAWKLISKHRVKGLLDTVRNRLLRFALELEKGFGWTGEDAPAEAVQNHAAVSQIFNTYVMGGTAHVVTGAQAEVKTLVAQVGAGDEAALRAALQSLGLKQGDIDGAIELARTEPPSAATPGPKTAAWLDKVKEAAATKLVGVPADIAVALAIQALKQYLGLG